MTAETSGDLSPMEIGAIALHETFCALVAGGFTETQACMVIAHILNTNAANVPEA